jgi:multidrug resistance efflux pump
MTVRRGLWLIALAAALGAALAGVMAVLPAPAAAGGVPTTRVARGSMKLDVHAAGEVRAGRVVPLAAPPVGASLRLVELVETGVAVRKGDVVMAFDPSDQEYALEQSRSELLEAEQEIVKMRADAAVQVAQDQVDLLTARFNVRRAEMDAAGGADLIGAIEAKKRSLALEEAKRRLAQIEEDVQSRAATSRAALAIVEEKRNKARLAAERAQQIIDSLIVRTPIDGLVVVKENRDASGGIIFFGMALPDHRVGDTVSPGRPVADVLAAGGLEVRLRVSEQDRGNVTAGARATVHADAAPGRPFDARVATLAGLASRGFGDPLGPQRLFDVVLRLDRPDPRLRSGTSVRGVIAGPEVDDVFVLPRHALFEKNGKPVVYARVGDRFEAREVKVVHRTESRVAIDGLAEGTEVALVNPDSAAGPAAPAAPAAPPVGGPR